VRAEVGLPASELSRTNQIQDPELQEKGHDIARWVKELRLPASLAPARAEFCLMRDGTRYRIEMAHQAWRYGISIEGADEEALLEYLRNIQSWVQKELNQ
jgi:hypothetical protein